MSAAFDMAPDPTNWSKQCECGGTKTRSATACERCTWLDGGRDKHAYTIGALRGSPGLTVRELAQIVDGSDEHSALTTMSVTLTVLLKQKRVRRYWRDIEIEYYGAGGRNGCWVYTLI
jgi:hypothetical protein